MTASRASQGGGVTTSAESRLEESLARGVLAAIIDAIVVIDERGIIHHFNPSAERLLGYSAADVLGRNVSCLMPAPHRENHDGYLAQYAKTGEAHIIGIGREVVARHASGKPLPVFLSVAVVETASGRRYCGTLRDLSELKAALGKQVVASNRLAAVLASVNVSVIATRVDGTIIEFNAGAEKMLGYRADELIHQHTPALLHDPAEVAAHAAKLTAEFGEAVPVGFETFVYKARRNLPDDNLWTYRCKDGTEKKVILSVSAVRDAEHNIEAFVGIATDISAQFKLAEDLRASEQQSQRRSRLLQTISQAQRDLLQRHDARMVFERLLDVMLQLTESEYGFIGEVLHKTDGSPYLKALAITNIAWNDETRAFYAAHAPQGLEFFNLNTLFGAVMRTQQVVISNSPTTDPRRGGLPPGHPALNAFLGLPFFLGQKMVGMIGIANRPGGYDADLIEFLQPLLSSFSSMLHAVKVEAERRKHLEELEQFNQFLDRSSDFIVAISPDDGVLRYSNASFQQAVGLAASDIIGSPLARWMPAPDIARLQTMASEQTSLNVLLSSEWQLGSNVIPVEVRWQTFLRPESEAWLLGVARDISERQRADRVKREFVATVSHELRTPLTSIRGSLGLLQAGAAGPLTDSVRELVKVADNNSLRLTALINDLLDIEKLDSGQLSLRLETTSVLPVVEASMASMSGYAEQFGVTLQGDFSIGQMQAVIDAERLQQVVVNLLSNAIKFSPRGGRVEIAAHRHGDGVEIAVTDQGSGIPESFRTRIFQRFSQADGSDTRRTPGTGLGLAISKSLVERMGGQIGFDTGPHGTRFFVWLPGANPLPAAKLDSRPGTQRILVCEDDPSVAITLKQMLEFSGYQVDLAASAAEARKALAATRYAAMTLDLSLPDEDGINFLRSLTMQPVPVIVVSGRADRVEEEGVGHLVMSWLTKPVNVDELRLVLGRTTKASARSRVLHVEDDPDIQLYLPRLLGADADIVSVKSVAAARARLREAHYDLVILDLNLPGECGEALLREFAGDPDAPPVLVFSVRAPDPEVISRVQEVLVKSRASNDNLISAVRRIIEANQAHD